MKRLNSWILLAVMTVPLNLLLTEGSAAGDVMRPEEIKSKRLVIYDDATYVKLAGLWKDYYREYPSEYAYANWMYAARYAYDKDYSQLLAKGLKEYPSNPILLYLKALECHGAPDNIEGRKYLERAVAIDPNFVDPWFALVTHYMDSGDEERLDFALRRLLESGIITDEIIDFNYNLLLSLEENGILITNGDNDTYPGWILTRILKTRPDIRIVNRSLLNTTWYPIYVIKQGLPRFISKGELGDLRDKIIRGMKKDHATPSPAGPFGDTLIVLIIESAKRAGCPVYFSKTVYITESLKEIAEKGRDLGLVTLVTPSKATYTDQLQKVYSTWINVFRTNGLESWRLKNAPQTDGGRMIVTIYAAGLITNLEFLKKDVPELRIKLFEWYNKYLEELLMEELRYEAAQAWCEWGSDIKAIGVWCKEQGMEQ